MTSLAYKINAIKGIRGSQPFQVPIRKSMHKDPTQTIMLRKQFILDINARFTALKSVIRTSIVKNDCFGLKDKPQSVQEIVALSKLQDELDKLSPIKPNAFRFSKSDKKVSQFMNWLNTQESLGVLEVIPGITKEGIPTWSNTYLRSSYQKGLAKGHSNLVASGVELPTIEPISGTVSTAFYQPVHAEAVGLIYTRVYDELKGVTRSMDGHISHYLSKGLASGHGPYQIASEIAKNVDSIGINRARLIARTETVVAFNTAAINEYGRAENIIGKKIYCQWWTAGDARVRPAHIERHGEVYTRDEAYDLLGEPNCRCTVLPYRKEWKEKPDTETKVIEESEKVSPKVTKAKTELEKMTFYDDTWDTGEIGWAQTKHKYFGEKSFGYSHWDDKLIEPIFPDEAYSQVNYIIKKNQIKSKTTSIKILPEDIYSLDMPVIEKNRVAKLIDDISNKTVDEALPKVIKYHNNHIIVDGNHNITANQLLGNKKLKVQLYNLDDNMTFKYIHHEHEFLKNIDKYTQELNKNEMVRDWKKRLSQEKHPVVRKNLKESLEIDSSSVLRKISEKESYNITKDYLSSWQNSTWKAQPTALKKAVCELETAPNLSHFVKTGLKPNQYKKYFDEFPVTQYLRLRAQTQAYFKYNNIKTITMYRGIGGETGKKLAGMLEKVYQENIRNWKTLPVNIKEMSLTGYTENLYTAASFGDGSMSGGATFKRIVNTKDIAVYDKVWCKKGYEDEIESILFGEYPLTIKMKDVKWPFARHKL